MVRLNKIYTRTGDDGSTALGDGRRRKKNDPRIIAYGSVDETNSAIGLARLSTQGSSHPDLLAIDRVLARGVRRIALVAQGQCRQRGDDRQSDQGDDRSRGGRGHDGLVPPDPLSRPRELRREDAPIWSAPLAG